MTPSTSLSAIDAVTSVIGPSVEERPEVVERDGQGGGAGRVVRTVEQHVAVADPQQLQPARPDGIRIAAPPRLVGDRRDPGRLERIERRIGDRHVRRLVAPAQADPGPSRAVAARPRSRRGPSRASGAGATSVSGTPTRRARRRMTARPSPLAPVTARSPRSMIAAFSRAILAIVSPSRSM